MSDYRKIELAIRALEKSFLKQPSLALMAKAAGMSEFHFQRVFTKWAGISPKSFLQYLTASYAKKRLLECRSILDASLEVGLSGPGRMHDLLIKIDAMSPGEYKAGGRGLRIDFGVHPSPFGDCLIAITPRGLCGLAFLANRSAPAALEELKANWPGAIFHASQIKTAPIAARCFALNADRELKLLLKGTPFQLKVWDALLKIPAGALVSYGDLAEGIGAPKAARAVGSAIGDNPIGYLIPCHRVIRETGIVGQYRWGTSRKVAMIAREGASLGV